MSSSPNSVEPPTGAQPGPSRLISAVLTPAVRLWLRSQLEHVDDLHLHIEAGDRQVLSGTIQRVVVSAHNAVYRGLHLSQISLTAEGIHTNLGQVVRGKPLRLLTVFPVSGSVQISEADLNRSLKAPLLGNALVDVLLTLLKSDLQDESGIEDLRLQDPQVNLRDGQLTLIATLVSASGSLTPVVIRTGLHLEAGRMLKLDRPQWLPHANARQGLPLKDLDGFAFDLGSEVCLETLTIAPEQIFCQGQIQVTPEES